MFDAQQFWCRPQQVAVEGIFTNLEWTCWCYIIHQVMRASAVCSIHSTIAYCNTNGHYWELNVSRSIRMSPLPVHLEAHATFVSPLKGVKIMSMASTLIGYCSKRIHIIIRESHCQSDDEVIDWCAIKSCQFMVFINSTECIDIEMMCWFLRILEFDDFTRFPELHMNIFWQGFWRSVHMFYLLTKWMLFLIAVNFSLR